MADLGAYRKAILKEVKKLKSDQGQVKKPVANPVK